LAWLALINSPAPQGKQAPQITFTFSFRLIGLGLGKQQMADGFWPHANATQRLAGENGRHYANSSSK
jgi:hypothetical protein